MCPYNYTSLLQSPTQKRVFDLRGKSMAQREQQFSPSDPRGTLKDKLCQWVESCRVQVRPLPSGEDDDRKVTSCSQRQFAQATVACPFLQAVHESEGRE